MRLLQVIDFQVCFIMQKGLIDLLVGKKSFLELKSKTKQTPIWANIFASATKFSLYTNFLMILSQNPTL